MMNEVKEIEQQQQQSDNDRRRRRLGSKQAHHRTMEIKIHG
jgi:hypothetical protein